MFSSGIFGQILVQSKGSVSVVRNAVCMNVRTVNICIIERDEKADDPHSRLRFDDSPKPGHVAEQGPKVNRLCM